jgi:hypothetical protein
MQYLAGISLVGFPFNSAAVQQLFIRLDETRWPNSLMESALHISISADGGENRF